MSEAIERRLPQPRLTPRLLHMTMYSTVGLHVELLHAQQLVDLCVAVGECNDSMAGLSVVLCSCAAGFGKMIVVPPPRLHLNRPFLAR